MFIIFTFVLSGPTSNLVASLKQEKKKKKNNLHSLYKLVKKTYIIIFAFH